MEADGTCFSTGAPLPQLCGKINFTITKEREERWIAVIRETARGGEDEITGRGAIASRL